MVWHGCRSAARSLKGRRAPDRVRRSAAWIDLSRVVATGGVGADMNRLPPTAPPLRRWPDVNGRCSDGLPRSRGCPLGSTTRMSPIMPLSSCSRCGSERRTRRMSGESHEQATLPGVTGFIRGPIPVRQCYRHVDRVQHPAFDELVVAFQHAEMQLMYVKV